MALLGGWGGMYMMILRAHILEYGLKKRGKREDTLCKLK